MLFILKIMEIHTHPDYDPGLFDADIALMQLDAPVKLNSRVQPICLPTEQTTRKNLVEGKKGVVSTNALVLLIIDFTKTLQLIIYTFIRMMRGDLSN